MLDVVAPLAKSRIYVALESGSRPSVPPQSMTARFPGQGVATVESAIDLARKGASRVTA